MAVSPVSKPSRVQEPQLAHAVVSAIFTAFEPDQCGNTEISWCDRPDRRDISEIDKMPWPRCCASTISAMATWAALWASKRRLLRLGQHGADAVLVTQSTCESPSIASRLILIIRGGDGLPVPAVWRPGHRR